MKKRKFNPIARAKEHPGLRSCINAKCWECMGGGDEADPRRLIRECSSPGCPLWPVRPYQQRTDAPVDNADALPVSAEGAAS